MDINPNYSGNKEGARYFILLSDYLLYTDYKVR